MTQWKVAFGAKKAGPFEKARVKLLVDSGKLPPEAFIRDENDSDDWQQVRTIDWLQEPPLPAAARYCPECDGRILGSFDSASSKIRCPHCTAPVKPIDYLSPLESKVGRIPLEPWGRYDMMIVVVTLVMLVVAIAGAFAIIFSPSLSVLIGFIFLLAGAGLFGVTYNHRSQSSKYREHLLKVEELLRARTQDLQEAQTELGSLKRNLVKAREDVVRKAEAEFSEKRKEIETELRLARDSSQVVHRMAERFLDETQKWWSGKLTESNFQLTKDRIQKAIEFCRKHGYEVPKRKEKEIYNQLKSDYELVLKRVHEREEQKRIREQIREEQRVERELQRELERIETEKRTIEKALKEALQKVGAEHSAEVEILRQKLAEAEALGQRTQAQAELTKTGHVYVISNLGAFGAGVFKVGLTRRLEPMDRVKELGDASVPFPFDVHMMIRSADAPKLEYTLHQSLHRYRVNRVNFRKEFFRVDLDTIRSVVEKHHGVVEYVADAEALEFRETQLTSADDPEFLAKVTIAAEQEDEDDDLDGADESAN